MMILLGWLMLEQNSHRSISRRRHRHRQPLDVIDLTLICVIKACLIILYLTIPQLVVDATTKNDNEAQQQHQQQYQKPDEAFFFLCSGGQVEELQAALEQNPGEKNRVKESWTKGDEARHHLLFDWAWFAVEMGGCLEYKKLSWRKKKHMVARPTTPFSVREDTLQKGGLDGMVN
jgi:hypothetical protein